MSDSLVVFCGVWPRSMGHFAFWPSGEKAKDPTSPWGYRFNTLCDGTVIPLMTVCDRQRTERQPEGVRYHFQKDGWTLVSWWDRSGDPRHGSIAAFAMQGIYTADEAETQARRAFPGVWARIDKHLGREYKPLDAKVVDLRKLAMDALAACSEEQVAEVARVLGVASVRRMQQ